MFLVCDIIWYSIDSILQMTVRAIAQLRWRLVLLLFWLFCVWSVFFFFFFFGCTTLTACGILVPWPGIEPRLSAVRTQSPNHWLPENFKRLSIIKPFPWDWEYTHSGYLCCWMQPWAFNSLSSAFLMFS